MTTHTNMKQIGCLICLAVLLAGCDTSKTINHAWRSTVFENDIVVEGVAYRALSTYGRIKDGSLLYLFTVVFPSDQYYYPAIRYVDGEITGKGEIHVPDETHRVNWIGNPFMMDFIGDYFRETNIADVPFHYVYVVDDGKIVFQKSYEELGFEVSDASNPIGDKRRLQPILEQLIRKHIHPQEPEMEEQQR